LGEPSRLRTWKCHAVKGFDSRTKDVAAVLDHGAKNLMLELVGKFVTNETGSGGPEWRSVVLKFLEQGAQDPERALGGTSLVSECFDEPSIFPVQLAV
jgi:hypothetical protein